MFHAVLSSDNKSDAIGITWTATEAKDGSTFGATTNAPVEISGGWYYLNFAAGDLNANTVALRLVGTNANTLNILFQMNQ